MNNKKGQLAIEYIIFIAIVLLFFNIVLYPNIKYSENVVNDIYNITQTKQSVEKLGLEISSLASSPGYGKRFIYFYLPKSSSINCDNINKTIDYIISISNQEPKPPITNCDPANNTCEFQTRVFVSGDLICDAIGPGYNGYLTIEKSQNGDLNVSR